MLPHRRLTPPSPFDYHIPPPFTALPYPVASPWIPSMHYYSPYSQQDSLYHDAASSLFGFEQGVLYGKHAGSHIHTDRHSGYEWLNDHTDRHPAVYDSISMGSVSAPTPSREGNSFAQFPYSSSSFMEYPDYACPTLSMVHPMDPYKSNPEGFNGSQNVEVKEDSFEMMFEKMITAHASNHEDNSSWKTSLPSRSELSSVNSTCTSTAAKSVCSESGRAESNLSQALDQWIPYSRPSLFSVPCKEQSNEARRGQNGNSVAGGAVADTGTDFEPEEPCSLEDCLGKPLFSGTDIRFFVKAITRLSDVLLSLCNDCIYELEEHDHELLELAIHNLAVFGAGSKRVMNGGSFHVSPPKASRSQDTGSKAMKIAITVSELGDTISISQNALGRTCSEPEENPRALAEKQPMEAEAAVCLMKQQELQLDCMKQMENHRHHTTGCSPQMTSFSSSNTVHGLDTPKKAQEERLSGSTPADCIAAEPKRDMYPSLWGNSWFLDESSDPVFKRYPKVDTGGQDSLLVDHKQNLDAMPENLRSESSDLVFKGYPQVDAWLDRSSTSEWEHVCKEDLQL